MPHAGASTMSPDEFLAWEREQRERHHYVRGEVFAMAGGSARHSFLGAQMIGLLRQGVLGRECKTPRAPRFWARKHAADGARLTAKSRAGGMLR